MISEKDLKLEIKRAKKAVAILKKENTKNTPSYTQLLNFLLLCRLEVELKLMQNLLQNFAPDGEQENA